MTHYVIPGPITNSEVVSDERIAQVALEVQQRLPRLNLKEIQIIVDAQSRTRYCAGMSDACTMHVRQRGRPTLSVVHVPWNIALAPQQLLAHELCHVYYFQTVNDADGGHKHRECFDDVVKRV